MVAERRIELDFVAGPLTFFIGWLAVFAFDAFEFPSQPPQVSPDEAISPTQVVEHYDFFAVRQEVTTPPLHDVTAEPQPAKKKLTCSSPAILPVWRQLLHDEYVQEMAGYSADDPDCSKMLELTYRDLNGDWTLEIILRGANSHLCGAVGNCGFWIFEKRGNQYVKILSSSDYVDVSALGEQVRKKRTNGYSDILLKGHFNVSDTNYRFFKFDGSRYRLRRHLVHAYVPGSSPNAKWEFISWRTYERRLEAELEQLTKK